MPHPRLRIFYATVSGTAHLVAQSIALELDDLGPGAVQMADLHDITADTLEASNSPVVFCIATTGSGNLPDDALPLYDALLAQPRYLGSLRYGLIALGDSSYGDTFCGGGEQLDAMLLDLGAQRMGDTLRIDACEEDPAEEVAVAWFRSMRSIFQLS